MKDFNKVQMDTMSNPNKKLESSSKDIPLVEKLCYTLMIANDMRTNINFFFQKDICHFRKKYRHIFNFCCSWSEYMTQAQFNMSLETEVLIIIKYLSVENLQRFTDLCCQQVEQYQDGILIRRPNKAGYEIKVS